MSSFLTFVVAKLAFGLPLECVQRAFAAVAPRPLPAAPDIVCGIINVQGDVLPVLNLRRLLGLPEREIEPGDRLLVVSSSRRKLVLIVDSVGDIITCENKDFVALERVIGGTRHVAGVVKTTDGMLLIHDLDGFLSPLEEQTLNAALAPTVCA
ncbi:MAG: chemotaxis protein CheW [Azoarcus sp.]|jgi:purine-binding chemotaxis protein CheW|nr:chemotaxis protein CheW [Azoarcus sp.]MDD2874201.1 chemotaxis protein CheW [Azoarcus sp.]MDX9837856.1 chemotaxis protein CheW [Azoarcus sp.]